MLLPKLQRADTPLHTELRQCIPCHTQWRGSLVSRCFNCGELGDAGWTSSPMVRCAMEDGEQNAIYPGRAPEPAKF